MGSAMTDATLEREIAALADLSRPALVARWRKLHRADPPKGISLRLLVRAIGYGMQARRYGDLKPATDRRLRMISNGTRDGSRKLTTRARGWCANGTASTMWSRSSKAGSSGTAAATGRCPPSRAPLPGPAGLGPGSSA